MSKLSRTTFKFFGSSSGADQIEQFGSLAGGTPVYTTDVATVQALSAWLEGWFGAVVGANLPAMEDVNAVFYVFAFMLAEIFQDGVPPWDAGTTYYLGSLVQDGNGVMYVSLQNTNLNNALSDSSFWVITGTPNVVPVNPGTTPTVAMGVGDRGKTFLVDTTLGSCIFTLPSPSLNFSVLIKDAGDAQTNNITINPHASETIDGKASLILNSNYAWVQLESNGTNWYIVNGQSASGGLTPTGATLMYGGVAAPSGYLLCDGTSYLISAFPALAAALFDSGTSLYAYGAADGTHFNVPDMRGMFPRGVDNGAGNDPDASGRGSANPNGNTGDNVGSVQLDEFESHNHTIQLYNNTASNGTVSWGNAGNPEGTAATAANGGNETRPKNVYFNFIIKT